MSEVLLSKFYGHNLRVEFSGCYTEKTLKRQARCLNCEKALESKLLPNYSDRCSMTILTV